MFGIQVILQRNSLQKHWTVWSLETGSPLKSQSCSRLSAVLLLHNNDYSSNENTVIENTAVMNVSDNVIRVLNPEGELAL